jgi:glycosyltransferase involved in cell wall biosynthesis
MQRVRTAGLFFTERGRRFTVRGVSYGPFRRNATGEPFPDKEICAQDLALVRALGANVLRLYDVPPEWLCALAHRSGVRLLVGIPWAQHIRFLDSRRTRDEIRGRVRDSATALRSVPNLLGYLVGNELSTQLVRWYGKRRIERWLASLAAEVRNADPDALVSYANFPTTEYLETDFADFLCFNVYLHEEKPLRDYLIRLQNLAHGRPLVLGEFGVDSIREGEQRQAAIVGRAVRSAEQLGCAGSIVFSFTDEWHTGGCDVEDWAFGLVRADRSQKPSYHELRRTYASAAPRLPRTAPRVSVVVCAYNEERTLEACLESLRHLRYPAYEVLVVDDGSTDGTRAIAERFPEFGLVAQENRGLSAARNVGIRATRGEIVAFTDADCEVDPDWLGFLVARLLEDGFAGVGGPNLPPPEDTWVAEVVARSPGGPAHVLLSDVEAEHIPGCNMAFWRHRLAEIGGFDPRFRVAGDDVDLCWRLQDAGHRLGFAPAALVWHRRRHTVAAYLRQQQGYGRAEAKLSLKHPARFNRYGQSRWCGRIYGSRFGCGARRRIYAGPFGSAPFQTLYESSPSDLGHLLGTLEWHVGALALVAVGIASPFTPLPLPGALFLGLALLAISVARAGRVAARVSCAGLPPTRTRLMVAFLGYVGPLARSLACHLERFSGSRRVAVGAPARTVGALPELDWAELRLVLSYWSEKGLDKASAIAALLRCLRALDLPAVPDDGWRRHDLQVRRDPWVEARLQLLVQDHGAGRRQLDVAVRPRPTRPASVLLLASISGLGMAVALGGPIAAAAVGLGVVGSAAWLLRRGIGLTRALCAAVALSCESLRVVRLPRA